MRGRRSGLIAIALVTLSVQLATAALGALGLCCPVDRAHAEGRPAAKCAMHAAQPPVDAHAGHHGTQTALSTAVAAPANDGTHMTCDCAAATHLAIGAPGLLPAPPALVVAIHVVGSADESREALVGLRSSPTSPPPRPNVSLVS